jgi:putative tricarboxylic transport membrane protein
MLFINDPALIYGLFIGFFVVQFAMIAIGLPGSVLFAQVVRLPRNIIASYIFFFSIMGSLAMNGNLFDVWVMFGFGLLGYVMKKLEFPAPPIVLGLVLGPLLELNLFSSLSMSHGSVLIFFTRPLCVVILAFSAISLLAPYFGSLKVACSRGLKALSGR